MERRLSHGIKDNGYVPLSWGMKYYTYSFHSLDLLNLSDDLRDSVIEDLIFQFRIQLQSTLFGGIWGEGNSKEMKDGVKHITKKKELQDLSYDDFELLKKTGMLWEFYPEAPLMYNEIKHEKSI